MGQEHILEVLPESPDHGLSVEEIAKQLGMVPSIVRNELYRLRRKGLVSSSRYTVKGKAGRFSRWWKEAP